MRDFLSCMPGHLQVCPLSGRRFLWLILGAGMWACDCLGRRCAGRDDCSLNRVAVAHFAGVSQLVLVVNVRERASDPSAGVLAAPAAVRRALSAGERISCHHEGHEVFLNDDEPNKVLRARSFVLETHDTAKRGQCLQVQNVLCRSLPSLSRSRRTPYKGCGCYPCRTRDARSSE